MNVITITGRLTADPTLRYTANGTAMLSFSVANDVGWGENKVTNFYDCTIWGKRAEGFLKDSLTKGLKVALCGEHTLNKYQKKDGTEGCSNRIRVSEIDIMAKTENANSQQTQWQQTPQGGKPAFQQQEEFVEDSDIPF